MADESKRSGLKPVDRRTFLRYGLIGATSAGLGGFGLSALGFMWPRLGDGFFGETAVGDAAELAEVIQNERTPQRMEGGLSVIVWDPSASGAEAAYGEHHQAILSDDVGLMALNSGSCPHLGLRCAVVPDLAVVRVPVPRVALQPAGGVDLGPAPRGLDRYAVLHRRRRPVGRRLRSGC
jgi:cytochrome b6-f complex iron-sulfur subunit